jgi:hypothetical protein
MKGRKAMQNGFWLLTVWDPPISFLMGNRALEFMGKRKKLVLKIEDKMKFIEVHERKISEERQKLKPDEGLIRHWESEIRGARKTIDRYKQRLKVLGWRA